ncbi:hypothetical protein E2542_SST23641 [Spatholobus suberectus]|nr:hypothetical protein E2542_SST23641 [Spatholobus suberectus]
MVVGEVGSFVGGAGLHDAVVRGQRDNLGDAESSKTRGLALVVLFGFDLGFGGMRSFCWWHDNLGDARLPSREFGSDGSVYGTRDKTCRDKIKVVRWFQDGACKAMMPGLRKNKQKPPFWACTSPK